MISTRKLKNRDGFTLVELLVVIVIIAALAALSFSVGPRMMAKAKANQCMQNMRQIGPVMSTYATDHSMTLPAPKGPVTQADSTTADLQWHEVCLSLLYPDVTPANFKTKDWWETTKCFLRNPLLNETAAPRGWSPLNPGYAINEMLVENIALATGSAVPANALSTGVALASIPDPGRTPLIAPSDNWHYRYDPAEAAGIPGNTVHDLLVDGKMPIMFVDGHVEVMTPAEYVQRELYLMPLPPQA